MQKWSGDGDGGGRTNKRNEIIIPLLCLAKLFFSMSVQMNTFVLLISPAV